MKENDVRLVTYVPDNVLTPLIKGATADNYFISVCTTREDEAIGMVAGAWMGGMRGCVMMQTSGFRTLPNALASLLMPYQNPGGADRLAARRKQPTTTQGTADVVAIARASGIGESHWIRRGAFRDADRPRLRRRRLGAAGR